MFQNHLKVALRTLGRHPAYTSINVLGLSVGLVCFMLIALYVQNEQRYDDFHENVDRIVRVTSSYTDGQETDGFARANPAVAPNLQRDISEVEAAVRFQAYSGSFVSGDQVFNETEIYFAEASVFDVFSFPLIQGNPSVALERANTAVLTEETAARYFGSDDPIGKVIVMSDTLEFVVTGVAQNVPKQSHIQFDMLLSFSTYQNIQAARGRDLDSIWSSGTFYTYALLTSADQVDAVQSQLPGFLERHIGPQPALGTQYSLVLQRLGDIHLRSDLRQEMGPNGSLTNNYVFSIIAVFILLISCINFMNLATARSTRRAREVGVRKSLGAIRSQLVRQFLSESVLLSFFSLVLATMLLFALLPGFNSFSGKFLEVSWSTHWAYLPLSVALAAFVGLLAGSYPAFLLSAFLPARVLKGAMTGGGQRLASVLRSGLVVFQFTLSIGIIAGTVITMQQIDFMRNENLGFDQEQIAVIPFSWDEAVQETFPTLKTQLLQNTSIQHVTASGDVPGRMFTSMSYWIEGMDEDASAGINALIIDPDFAETYGLTLVAGQDFSIDQSAALGESFLLNEAAVAEMGMTPDEVVGKRFHMNSDGPILGVVKDFHFAGLQNSLEPLVMTVWPSWFGYISMRLDAAHLNETLAYVEETWTSSNPNRPFEYFFLDDDFARLYQAESQFGQLFVVFAVLAIFISCLGLFGLAVFTAEQRTREIGVRKVLGASVRDIVILLNRDMTFLVTISAILAAPIAYFVMNSWLGTFAYRVDVSPLVFIFAGFGALVVMWMTVGFQSARTAVADPVKAIRS